MISVTKLLILSISFFVVNTNLLSQKSFFCLVGEWEGTITTPASTITGTRFTLNPDSSYSATSSNIFFNPAYPAGAKLIAYDTTLNEVSFTYMDSSNFLPSPPFFNFADFDIIKLTSDSLIMEDPFLSTILRFKRRASYPNPHPNCTMFSGSSPSIVDLEVKFVNPITDTVHDTDIRFTVQIKNVGLSMINSGDSIVLGIGFGSTLVKTEVFVAPTSGFSPGDSIVYSDSIILPFHPTIPTYDSVCVAIGLLPTTSYIDFVNSNDVDCYVMSYSLVSVPEALLKDKVDVFVKNAIVDIAYKGSDDLFYQIISISGNVLSQGKFTNRKQVDLETVSSGIYIVNIANNKGKITKKIIIQ